VIWTWHEVVEFSYIFLAPSFTPAQILNSNSSYILFVDFEDDRKEKSVIKFVMSLSGTPQQTQTQT